MTNSSSPPTNSSQPVSISDPVQDTTYACIGGVAFSINLITVLVLFSNRVLLRRSVLLLGITLGNLFMGLQLLTSGFYRLLITVPSTPPTFGICMATVFPVLYPLAFNIEGTFLLLGGIERLLAVVKATWFRNHWTTRNSWYLAIAAYIFVIGTVTIGLLLGRYYHLLPLGWGCSIPAMYSIGYLTFLTAFSAFTGTVSAVLTAAALIFGVRRTRMASVGTGDTNGLRRQVQLTKSMATVSCIELVLVALPNFISFLTSMGITFSSSIRPWNNSYTQATNASVAFFAFSAFNSKFRAAFLRLFNLKKMVDALKSVWSQNKDQVQPISGAILGNESTNATRRHRTSQPSVSILVTPI